MSCLCEANLGQVNSIPTNEEIIHDTYAWFYSKNFIVDNDQTFCYRGSLSVQPKAGCSRTMRGEILTSHSLSIVDRVAEQRDFTSRPRRLNALTKCRRVGDTDTVRIVQLHNDVRLRFNREKGIRRT